MNQTKPETTDSASKSWLSSVLTCSLLVSSSVPLTAQQGVPENRLSVEVVQGERHIHNISIASKDQVTVQATDKESRPVSGAVVVFQLPSRGPGATFYDELRFATKLTDKQGLATARGLRPNKTPGEFKILVTASHKDFEPANLEIAQTNVDSLSVEDFPRRSGELPDMASPVVPLKKKGRGSGMLVTIVAIVGGAAAGAALGYATRPGSSPAERSATAAAPTKVSAGAPNFGPP